MMLLSFLWFVSVIQFRCCLGCFWWLDLLVFVVKVETMTMMTTMMVMMMAVKIVRIEVEAVVVVKIEVVEKVEAKAVVSMGLKGEMMCFAAVAVAENCFGLSVLLRSERLVL